MKTAVLARLGALLLALPALCAASGTMDEAKALVAEAEKSVEAARRDKALWTSAEEALRQARRNLDAGNAAAAAGQARFAIGQSALGIAQRRYPPVQ